MATSSKLNIIDVVAYGYLSLPLLLFIVGWIWTPLALLLVAAFLIVSWKTFPSFQRGLDVLYPYKRAWRESISIACMFALILFMAGLTGNWQQHSDFPVRNDIFYNLVADSWPPQLQDGRYFVYYFQAWLPAALVGKVVGWGAAQWIYYAWCLLGMYLVLHYVFQKLGKVTFVAGALFLVWNGLELLPGLLLQYVSGGGGGFGKSPQTEQSRSRAICSVWAFLFDTIDHSSLPPYSSHLRFGVAEVYSLQVGAFFGCRSTYVFSHCCDVPFARPRFSLP